MPGPSPEMGSYQRREVLPATPERPPQPSIESQPKSKERLEVQQPVQPAEPVVIPAQPVQPLLPTPTQAAPVVPVTQNATSPSTPVAANDTGLIEKEWVDKAKQIVQQTKDDPYEQEKEVSKLQADYMKKRYDKDIKLSS